MFDVLLGALNDHEFGVVNAAHESLTTLTGQDIGTDSRDWLAWSQKHRQELFKQQQRYTYQPYDAPPSLLDKMRFWDKQKPVTPREPVGLEEASAGGQSTPNS